MHETPRDLERLQALLDTSYAQAGDHLRMVHAEPARLDATRLVAEMDGMQIVVVATVTADGRPITGPVESFLYRGRMHFGSRPTAVRTRHLSRSPAVSATHVRGEDLVVSVHGQAVAIDPRTTDDGGFADLLCQHYGADWDDVFAAAPQWAIEPDRIFAADFTVLSG